MHTVPFLRKIGPALILAGAAMCALAAAPTLKVLNVGNAAISLAWDAAWQVSQPDSDAPPNTAQFHTPDRQKMLVMITAESRPSPGADAESFMRHVMDESVKQFQPQSVEKELVPKAFKNGDTRGYKVCATDRAPKPDEYKYVCQGVAVAGDLAVIFTVLYNDSGKADANKALTSLEALQVTTGA